MKSFLIVFVWFPYAFSFLNDFATNNRRRRQFAKQNFLDTEISRIQKQLLQFQLNSNKGVSIFEFREVSERYAGLTLACQSNNQTPSEPEKEIFRVSLRQNSQLASICLNRLNLQKLRFHQIHARKDFLQMIALLKIASPQADSEKIRKAAFEFINILNDEQAIKSLEDIFAKTLQSDSNFPVKDLEKEIWKSKEQKPLPSSLLSTHFTTLTSPTIFKKD